MHDLCKQWTVIHLCIYMLINYIIPIITARTCLYITYCTRVILAKSVHLATNKNVVHENLS